MFPLKLRNTVRCEPKTLSRRAQTSSGTRLISREVLQRSNVAPLDIALAVIPDEGLRSRFRDAGSDTAEVSCFGYTAAVAAYGDAECEAWRQRLVAYLRANRDHSASRLQAMGISCVRPEASYLMWMDCTDVLPQGMNAEEFFLESGVALTGGVAFGGSPSTVRLNLGCRRETLDEGLARMASAISRLEP